MGNFFTFFLLGLCFISLNLLFISVAGLLRYFPQALAAVGRIATYGLRLSVRAYNALFMRLGPSLWRMSGLEINQGWGRMETTTVLSLLLSLAIFIALGLQIGWMTIVIGLAHGIGVNLIWERVLFSDSLRMGEEI